MKVLISKDKRKQLAEKDLRQPILKTNKNKNFSKKESQINKLLIVLLESSQKKKHTHQTIK